MRPVPDEHVPIRRVGVAFEVVLGVDQGAGVHHLELQLDADVPEPADDELAGGLVLGRVRSGVEAQAELLAALGLAVAVAVDVLVAGCLKDLVGFGGIVGVQLVRRRLPVVRGVRHDERGTDGGVAVHRHRHDLLAVDRPVDGLAKLLVEQHRVAQRVRVVIAVHADLRELPRRGIVGRKARLGAELIELRRRYVDGSVDGPQLEVLRHRVGVRVELEDDFVRLRSAAPVVRVGLEADELALLPLDDLEGPVTDDGRLVLVRGGRRLAADLAPDVLRQNRHDHLQDVGLGGLGVDLHGSVVGGFRLGDAVGVSGQVERLVLVDVVESEGDVPGSHRHTVLPLAVAANRERPHLAVRRDLPLGGQLGAWCQGLGVEAHQEIVVEMPEHVVGDLDADERVEVVGLLDPADAQRGLGVGGRTRRGEGDVGQQEDGGARQQQRQEESRAAVGGVSTEVTHPCSFRGWQARSSIMAVMVGSRVKTGPASSSSRRRRRTRSSRVRSP